MNFEWKVCSVFDNFSIVCENMMKSTQCTPTHTELSNGTKSGASKWLGKFQCDGQNKTNKLCSFIDRLCHEGSPNSHTHEGRPREWWLENSPNCNHKRRERKRESIVQILTLMRDPPHT
jgi:hypothetical protein